jgi:hypothetical protein
LDAEAGLELVVLVEDHLCRESEGEGDVDSWERGMSDGKDEMSSSMMLAGVSVADTMGAALGGIPMESNDPALEASV